jgi:hypothetical protein
MHWIPPTLAQPGTHALPRQIVDGGLHCVSVLQAVEQRPVVVSHTMFAPHPAVAQPGTQMSCC